MFKVIVAKLFFVPAEVSKGNDLYEKLMQTDILPNALVMNLKTIENSNL